MSTPKIVYCPTANLVNRRVKRCYVNHAYYRAIEHAGGVLVAVPSADIHVWQRLLTSSTVPCGVLLQGGCDINPVYYDSQPEDGVDYDRDRDQLEIGLVRYLLYGMKIPLLGICRGMQVMNVAMGGSLKNLGGSATTKHFRCDIFRDQKSHGLRFKSPRSPALRGIDEVNSIHHQAISKLARCFRVLATAEDGTVEAIRSRSDPYFCLGVQWHPEELPDHTGIFYAFIESIR